MAVIKTFGKEYNYVLKHEQKIPKAEQTVWHYKLPTLDAQVDEGEEVVLQGDFTSEESKDYTAKVKSGSEVKKQAKIIKTCLIRVENLFNDDKQPVEWPINTRTKDNSKEQENIIATLPPAWRAELAGVFRNAASVEEEAVKN